MCNDENYEEAKNLYRKALKIKPNYTNAYINLGVVSEYCDEFDEAINCFQKAANLKPNDPKIYSLIGSVLEKSGKNKYAKVSGTPPAKILKTNNTNSNANNVGISIFTARSIPCWTPAQIMAPAVTKAKTVQNIETGTLSNKLSKAVFAMRLSAPGIWPVKAK